MSAQPEKSGEPRQVRIRDFEEVLERALALLKDYHDQILAMTGSVDGWLVIEELESALRGDPDERA